MKARLAFLAIAALTLASSAQAHGVHVHDFAHATIQALDAPAPVAAPVPLPSVGEVVKTFLAFLGALIALMSTLSNWISPRSKIGWLISWLSGNGGKILIKLEHLDAVLDEAGLLGPDGTPKPEAPKSFGFIKRGPLLAILGLSLCVACVASWRAASASAASCYGITAAQRDQARSDVVNAIAKAFPAGNYLGALESLGSAYANDPVLKCAADTVIAEIEHPNGGEAPFVPPDGGPAVPAVTFAHVSTSRGTEAKQVPVESLAALQDWRAHLSSQPVFNSDGGLAGH